jgi:DNA-binding IclR family transcriptional regulator
VGLARLTPVTITDPEALIDEMALTRKRGYAVNRCESGDVHSIASPIRRFDGKVIAAVAVSFRPDADILGTVRESATAQRVMETARRISFSVGYRVDQLV